MAARRAALSVTSAERASDSAPKGGWTGVRWRLWREWCFWRSVERQMRPRALILAAAIAAGALTFRWLDAAGAPDLLTGAYRMWGLVFGETPEVFPRHWLLRVMYFLVPIIGLTVIIEGIVEFSLLVRDRRRAEASWSRIMASSMREHVIIVGLGKLGYRVFAMFRAMGRRVAVIEQDAQGPFLDAVRADGSPILIGDARREVLLEEAGIANASVIMITTNNDLANLEIALDARRLSPRIRIVLRMFDQALADKVARAAGVHAAMSQSAISAPAFVSAALAGDAAPTVVVEGRVMALDWIEAEAAGPHTVGELGAALGGAVVELRMSVGRSIGTPAFNQRVSPGDRVLILRGGKMKTG